MTSSAKIGQLHQKMSLDAGKLLRVDLSTGKAKVEPIPEQVKRDFWGGRGFGIFYLYQELAPGIDPLGPENKILFLCGILAGSSAQGFAKWIVMAKSPLTGGIGRAAGGADFGAWIKFAGFDAIIVEGRAKKPVYIYVEKDRAEVRDASELWGLDTEETQNRLQEIHGPGTRAACIGPAGEKLVRYAAVVSARRTASRCGHGAVMGSKNLKAVAINATGRPTAANPELFKKLVQEQIAASRDDPRRIQSTEHGTTWGVDMFGQWGITPVHNFQEGSLKGRERLTAEVFTKLKVGNFGCYSCMTNCGQIHKLTRGSYKGVYSEGPEYESIFALGAALGNTNTGSVVQADCLCDLLGLDTISTGVSIAFAYELFQRGIITAKDTDGLELTWGNHEAMIELVKKIGQRQGFGQLLGEGSKRAADSIGQGAQHYAIHSKGTEMGGYDPRAVRGYALGYSVSNIGASHMYGRPREEIYGRVDRFTISEEERTKLVIANMGSQAFQETTGMCNFTSAVTHESLAKLLVAGTGNDVFADLENLRRMGEKIVCLERVFNVREGFSRKDDTLPVRMLAEPLKNAGPSTGMVVQNFDGILDLYYDMVGYTRLGIPSREKLKELGLGHVIKDVERYY